MSETGRYHFGITQVFTHNLHVKIERAKGVFPRHECFTTLFAAFTASADEQTLQPRFVHQFYYDTMHTAASYHIIV